MKEKNLAVEILKKLLAEQISVYKRTNAVKSEKFSEMMQMAINRYINGLITNAEVIEELLKMAKQIADGEQPIQGLSKEETAFYDALTKPQAVKDFYQNEELVAMTTELTDTLRTYIKERFGFNALEMTSTEIIEKLLETNDKEALSDLRTLFQTADLVKFAKHNPLMNENDANLINAVDFINETKEKEDENAKPQPTEITIVEKRSLQTKILLGVGAVLAAAALIWAVVYICKELYNYFA